jgi:hypothetical protein
VLPLSIENLSEVSEKVSLSLNFLLLNSSVMQDVFLPCTQRWRYEKLPIAGDFLSSYTKVGAGYNP